TLLWSGSSEALVDVSLDGRHVLIRERSSARYGQVFDIATKRRVGVVDIPIHIAFQVRSGWIYIGSVELAANGQVNRCLLSVGTLERRLPLWSRETPCVVYGPTAAPVP